MKAENEVQTTVEERASGALLGLAWGDRNGGPIRMAVRLAESLDELQQYNVDDVANRYLSWWREGAFDTGRIAGEVFRLVAEEGMPWERASAQVHRTTGAKTAGCNPAHRSVPLAMAAFVPERRLAHVTALEAGVTHWDPLSGETAIAVVTLCRLLIEGTSWDDALLASGFGRHFRVEQALRVQPGDTLKRGGYGPDVLKAAIAFLQAHTDFRSALTASLEFAGPANFCPVLVGAIGGARWGVGALEAELGTHVGELLPRVERAAKSLAASWQ